ncbi:alanyl-tRNA editing protein [Metabacillus bambusae]|uniref:Alanyl-tRNA editing protein n=1 Tax=Metabacillus bambusae TaxID=2795218 RepID=A0ABS3N2L4_9BACI|nr:DHHA1 domain-containing protein [Metabacillus bambusae]MBO1512536.1 alanyl-tRNA editing protein [Metabacillus bambusae]
MTTEKVYYQDPYKQSITTKLVMQAQDENGRFYVVLEKTIFYPTGGGQPHDTGNINGVHVYEVEEMDGEIRHYVEQPIEIQNKIAGEIAWDRRFDHMQQHSGQHILSAAFEEVYGYKTVSFHLGKELCTIDLEIPNLTEEEANHTEELANKIILENRPIETKWITEAELSHYSLRKELSVSENIRLVIIPNFDYNGCGGTHPNSTGQVSSIKILNWEKHKNYIRLHFVCGNRVLKQLHEKQSVIQSLTTILNSPQGQMKDAANRLLQQSKELEKTVVELKAELLQYEARSHIANVQIIHERKVVQVIFKNRPISELQQLARSITNVTNDILVLLISENEDKLQLVCSRSKEINGNMNQLLKGVLPVINGRGGGNDSFAQGGGERTISAEQLMRELMDKSMD